MATRSTSTSPITPNEARCLPSWSACPPSVRSGWTATTSAPAPTRARPPCRPSSPRSMTRACPCAPPPWRARLSTMSTCVTQAAGSTTPTSSPPPPAPEDHDDRHRHPYLADDRPTAPGARPAARLPGDQPDPARDLAVPVWVAVPEDSRAAGLRHLVLPGLPGARRSDHERAVDQHVERDDGARGDRPG